MPERLVVQVDRPAGGWHDAHRIDRTEYLHELHHALRTETRPGTTVRGCLYRGTTRVRVELEAHHDGQRWHFSRGGVQ